MRVNGPNGLNGLNGLDGLEDLEVWIYKPAMSGMGHGPRLIDSGVRPEHPGWQVREGAVRGFCAA